MPAARALTASQNEWLRVRSYLQEHRYDLALDAAGDYPAARRIAGTPLLAAPGWQPAEPVPLQDIGLEFTAPEVTAAPPRPAPAGPARPGEGAAPLLPERPDGTRYLRYSDAMRELAAPAVFENRPTYRLTEADLGASRLAFTRGRYFDGVDTGEAAAHEYAAARLGGSSLTGRPARPGRGPVRPAPPPGEPGHQHADAPVRRGHRAGVVPAALAGPGQGGSCGRDVPGDPGRRVPASRPGARTRGFLAVAVHDPRV